MKRTALLSVVIIPLLTMVACTTTPPRATSPAGAPPDKAVQMWGQLLDELIPGLGAEKIADRAADQLRLEELCFQLGAPGQEAQRRAACTAMAMRLDPRTPRPARVWMLRQLERIGQAECVPALAALLTDEDGEIRDLARRVLQNDPAPSAAAALTAALPHARDAAWQIALLNAVAVRGDASIVPVVARYAHAEDAAVSAAGIYALGEIGVPAARLELLQLWRAGTPAAREAAGTALVRLAERLAQRGETAAAELICDEILRAATEPPLRRAALRGMAMARGAAYLPELLAIVRDEQADSSFRALAAELMAGMPGTTVTAALIQQYADVSPSGQTLLIGVFAQRGDVAARTVVLTALQSADADVRLAAAAALQGLGDREAALALARVAAEAPGALQDTARKSLARISGDDVDSALTLALQGAASNVRVELIRALAARWYHSSVPALLLMVNDPDENVRVAAFEAVGTLGGPGDVTALVPLALKAESEAARTAAENALVAVCGRIEDAAQRATPVLAMWDKVDDVARASVVRVLGRVGGAAALEKIRLARRSENEDVADAGVRALAQWPTADVQNDLLELAKSAKSKAHRVLALQGFIRVVGLPSERPVAETTALYKTALELAERPEERKAVLAGLGKVSDVAALQLIEQQLGDEALRTEAEAALVAVVPLVAGEHGAAAKAALQRVLDVTKSEENRKAAKKTLAKLQEAAGGLVTWQVSGPYRKGELQAAALFAEAFAPELPEGKAVWRKLAPTSKDKPWIFDLLGLDKKSDCCAYVRCAVWSEKAQPARLEVGSDDGLKVWLNGKVVHEFKDVRSHTVFQDKVPVELQAGWNTLQLKIVQGSGDWAFSAAIRDANGEPLDGLKAQAEPPKP